MRSLARALSSSRRAPPKHASNPCSAIASSSDTDCRRLRDAPGPGSPQRPRSIDACTDATTRRAPSLLTTRSRKSSTSWKLWPVSTCMTGNGNGPGRAPWRRGGARPPSPCRRRTAATGVRSSAATSRMMKIACDSSASRWSSAAGSRAAVVGAASVSVIDASHIRSWHEPAQRPARVLTLGHRPGARPAADRRVAVDERVHGQSWSAM